ncbi:MAG: phosphoribosylanthranilate isomerase [Anditalea sp.]
MTLKTFVKISNVNNLSDARYCAGMYVHLMGFNLEEHNRNYLSPDKFKEITEWLSGLKYVGEFENSHPDNILEIVKSYKEIDYIQIREEAHLQMLVNTRYNLILKQQIRDAKDIQHLIAIAPSLKENNVVLLLESDNQTLQPEFIQLLKDLAERTPVLLGFGINADTVEDVLEQTKIKGIALNGGDEIKPGFKDFDGLADILEILELDE